MKDSSNRKKDIPASIVSKIDKLAELAAEVRKNPRFAISITRLTSLKSLCQDPAVAAEFALHIAKLTRDKMIKEGHSRYIEAEQWNYHKELVIKAVSQLEAYLKNQTKKAELALERLLSTLADVQNKYKNIGWNTVRIIENRDVLIVEKALRCVLSPEVSGHWAYHLARDFTEDYDPSHGTGLIPSSAKMVEAVADFWCKYYFDQSLTERLEYLGNKPARGQKGNKTGLPNFKESELNKANKNKVDNGAGVKSRAKKYTAKQGQFLAFIYYYTKIHKRPPAEADMQQYFNTSAPAVHQMVTNLVKLELIEKPPGQARAIKLLLRRNELPDLE
jgi:DNA-binding MarR family transcriptional regulator